MPTKGTASSRRESSRTAATANATELFMASRSPRSMRYELMQTTAMAHDMASAAFEARGLGVIDLEHMLSSRVDAHPASANVSVSDVMHYCQPGPADWALDAVVRRVGRE